LTGLQALTAEKTALLLVDLQADYLQQSGLQPAAPELLGAVAALLQTCRNLDIPVLHSRTLVAADGANAMPHRQTAPWRCGVGTLGAQAPAELVEQAHETVLQKNFFSAFANPRLQEILQQADIQHLIIVGLYTHACIQATVLDAYQRGYRVYLPQDGIASAEPLHAALSLQWLQARACTRTSVQALQAQLEPGSTARRKPQGERFPLCYTGGNWLQATSEADWIQHNPAHWDDILGAVPLARDESVQQVTQRVCEAQVLWQRHSRAERAAVLSRWQETLAAQHEAICALLALEVGKPWREAQAEYAYAQSLLAACLENLLSEPPAAEGVRYLPWGTVGLITPWNNPLAIPVGKIAPALAYGNTLVWKPALQAPRLARLICDSLLTAGLPPAALGVVFGDADTGRALAVQPEIGAISFTGSTQAGQELALRCAATGKGFQAEMGGNNAVIISSSADIAEVARALAPAVYSFAGQRCTAPRRLIVPEQHATLFVEAFIQASQRLQPGPLHLPETLLAPLISRAQQEATARRVEASLEAGARVLQGGYIPAAYAAGCWYAPTLICDLQPLAPLVQEESFAPLAVLLTANDFEQALQLCNAVSQGLSASLYSNDAAEQQNFLTQAQAGILRINTPQAVFAAQAPFGGWKASGLGTPEHGGWDRQFYTRPQAVYQSK